MVGEEGGEEGGEAWKEGDPWPPVQSDSEEEEEAEEEAKPSWQNSLTQMTTQNGKLKIHSPK